MATALDTTLPRQRAARRARPADAPAARRAPLLALAGVVLGRLDRDGASLDRRPRARRARAPAVDDADDRRPRGRRPDRAPRRPARRPPRARRADRRRAARRSPPTAASARAGSRARSPRTSPRASSACSPTCSRCSSASPKTDAPARARARGTATGRRAIPTAAMTAAHQAYLLQARQMQALSFCGAHPARLLRHRLPGDGPVRRVAVPAHRRRALPHARAAAGRGSWPRCSRSA